MLKKKTGKPTPTSIIDDYKYLNRRMAEIKEEREQDKEYEYCEECDDSGWIYDDEDEKYRECPICRNQHGNRRPDD